jgi:LAO/AO transport system ATPase
MVDDLLERFRRRDRLALARLLSLLARGEQRDEILTRVGPPPKPARVVAITGSGGVGKSTLVGKLIGAIRQQGQTVAVLACDPQSPLSGGALLGDRFRMPSHPDEGVFIRSLAAAGGHRAVAEHAGALVRLLEAFGFDVILLETVGAGQGDTAVRDLADVVVLLLQPETGDDVQWEKAGLLEVADVVVLHKADLPGAEAAEAQVRAALNLSANRSVPVLRVSARTGEGLDLLWQTIVACPLRRVPAADGRSALLHAAQETLADWFDATSGDSELDDLAARWRTGSIGREDAARALWQLLERKRTKT